MLTHEINQIREEREMTYPTVIGDYHNLHDRDFKGESFVIDAIPRENHHTDSTIGPLKRIIVMLHYHDRPKH